MTCGIQNQDEIIHVILCVYDPSENYSQHAGVVMTSIFENTKSKVLVHLFHDDTLTPNNRKKLIRTAEKYSQSIEFIDLTDDEKRFSKKTYILTEKWTIGAMYRLFAPEVLNLDKVLYLDCDIVVNLDIKEMWDIDVSDYYLAGVHSTESEEVLEAFRNWLNGSRGKTSINSGVMILNLKKIREWGDLFTQSMQWIERHFRLMSFSDQDIINNLFYGSIKLIDPKFNVMNPTTEDEIQNCIIHHPGTPDIWAIDGLPSQNLYWHNYVRSAWGENKTTDEIVNGMFRVAKRTTARNSPYFHERAVSCVKRLMISVPRKIFWRNMLITPLRYICIEIFYRIKYKFFSKP